MKFLIAFACVLVAAQAQYIRNFGEVVHGGKTIVAGPSGTIHADTGAIVKTPETRAILAEPVIARHAPLITDAFPLTHSVLRSPLISSRTIIDRPLLRHSTWDLGLSTLGLHHGLLY